MLLLALVSCGGPDEEQVRLCSALLPAVETGGTEILSATALPGEKAAVRIDYGTQDAPGWLVCRFAGSGLAAGRLELVEVETSQDGVLSEVRLAMLRTFWLERFGARLEGAATTEQGAGWQAAYALQQGLNALTLGAVYALLAMAYTLVHAVLGRINLAFGDLATFGGFVCFLTAVLVAVEAGLPLLMLLVAAPLAAAFSGALAGHAVERTIFRPLIGAAGQAALIASLGFALVVQEGLRLLQGADDLWLGPLGGATWTLMDAGGFAVVASVSQAVVVGGVALLLALQFGVVDRGRFGRQWRAVAADRPMAALVGVDVGRISGLVMALATLYAALAGAIVVLHYGGVSFHMGTMLGFKALTAAILGGLGSPAGAVLGALTVAGVETFWTGYVDTQSKDIAVFGLLAIALMARPQGLGLVRLRGPGME